MISMYASFSVWLLVMHAVSIFPNDNIRDTELVRIVTDQCQCILHRKNSSINKHQIEKNSTRYRDQPLQEEKSPRPRDEDTSVSGTDCPAQFLYHFKTGTPSGFGTYWPSCYKFIVHEKFPWEDAFNVCSRQGALLISIETEDEQKHVKRIINEELVPKPNASFWTSGSDEGSNDEWSWRGTGDPIEFTAWSWKNPNDREQQCLSLWDEQDWAWDDDYCSRHLYVLCEKNVKSMV